MSELTRLFHKYAVVLSLSLWCITAYYWINTNAYSGPNQVGVSNEIGQSVSVRQLQDVVDKIEKLSLELAGAIKLGEIFNNDLTGSNVLLQNLINKLNDENDSQVTSAPSLQHEYHLRGVYDSVEETWYYSQHEVSRQAQYSDKVKEKLLQGIRTRKNAALVEVELMRDLNKVWRRNEAQRLQNIVQRRIQFIQNPPNCSAARKLVCSINKFCGFGCQMTHATMCFMVAFGSNRTLILKSNEWSYSKRGWESLFVPLSDTCTDAGGNKAILTSDGLGETQIVSMGFLSKVTSEHLPLSIPRDLADDIMRLHGNPALWWLSQFVRYLMRIQPDFNEMLDSYKRKIGFHHPVVGVHIRRTDKLFSEASFHGINEYMVHVESWFERECLRRQRLNLTLIDQPTVYIATDEPSVYKEAETSFPNYKFIGDSDATKSASTTNRFSEKGLIGIVTDVMLLSECDYIVGTFSSGVSRLAYELMQTRHADATTFAHSLDDLFYFSGQTHGHIQRAIYNHNDDNGALSFDVGDKIGIMGNHWDGFSKGKLFKHDSIGLYPSFKARDVIKIVDFPPMPEADNISLKHEFTVQL